MDEMVDALFFNHGGNPGLLFGTEPPSFFAGDGNNEAVLMDAVFIEILVNVPLAAVRPVVEVIFDLIRNAGQLAPDGEVVQLCKFSDGHGASPYSIASSIRFICI